MNIITDIDEISEVCAGYRAENKRIGFVPTMGALHDGHSALLRRARQVSDIGIMSIFVNPTQFGPGEDLDKYPRLFEADCALAQTNGCDIMFAPPTEAMYPQAYATFVSVEGITSRLCGAARPGHFRGVTTVVLKFFNIVSPHVAVFGQKDAQQVIVLRRMVRDLNCPVTIIVEPTVREHDGLALSSRNRYLTAAERSQAPLLFKGLTAASRLFDTGERSALRLRQAMESVFTSATLLKPEYIEIVDITTLEPLTDVCDRALIAIAARTTETATRLIDNVTLGGDL